MLQQVALSPTGMVLARVPIRNVGGVTICCFHSREAGRVTSRTEAGRVGGWGEGGKGTRQRTIILGHQSHLLPHTHPPDQRTQQPLQAHSQPSWCPRAPTPTAPHGPPRPRSPPPTAPRPSKLMSVTKSETDFKIKRRENQMKSTWRTSTLVQEDDGAPEAGLCFSVCPMLFITGCCNLY